MEYSIFPNPEIFATPEGIVAVTDGISVPLLYEAYSRGIFPWPVEGLDQVPWFSPPLRAVLFYQDLHLSRSLKRFLKHCNYRATINKDFRGVIHNCKTIKRNDPDAIASKELDDSKQGTWITDELEEAYIALSKRGVAQSVEVWDEHDNLIGGTYGVSIGGIFTAESMFHKKENASKFAILHLVNFLHERGLDWLDIQTLTPHMERLGAKEIPRKEFLNLLLTAKGNRLSFKE